MRPDGPIIRLPRAYKIRNGKRTTGISLTRKLARALNVFLQASSAVQMAVVLPERNARATQLHGNTDVVQPANEHHVPVTERHGARALGGQSSGLGPDGHIDGQEQLRRFVTLNERLTAGRLRANLYTYIYIYKHARKHAHNIINFAIVDITFL